MKLRDMVSTLRTIDYNRVEIRDEEGNEITTCKTNSKGIEPYLDYEITEWFSDAAPFKHCDFTVYVKE